MPDLPEGYVWYMNEFTNVNNEFLSGSLVLCEQIEGELHGEVECRVHVRPGEDTTAKIQDAARLAYAEWLMLPEKVARMERLLSERNHRYAGLYPPNTLVD